jgi:pyruvate,orthophosphate dikinase
VSTTYVYDFARGSRGQSDLLGGKGANLAEMTRLGLPVPPGFTITTQACRAYLQTGEEPPELAGQISAQLDRLEERMGRRLGDPDDPLLVSVRSGARFSMPGMMETVLNIGLNDASVKGMGRISDDKRFAWDSYRRLIQMFGKTVLDIDGHLFESALDKVTAPPSGNLFSTITSAKLARGPTECRRPPPLPAASTSGPATARAECAEGSARGPAT